MPRIFVLLPFIVLMTSCHGGGHPAPATAKGYHLRFNPSDSSRYQYHTTSQTEINVTEGAKTYRIQRSWQFTVDYLITRDSDEFVLEMTFDTIDFHERDSRTGEADAATVPPVPDLLNQMKTSTIFGRVRPSNQLITLGWTHEVIAPVMNAYFAEADRVKATEFWGLWVEQNLVWQNLDPFAWVKLDSAGRPGDHWTDTTTNETDMYFKINKRLWFDRLDGAVAMVRSQGRMSTGPGGGSLWGQPAKGSVEGVEGGKCLVDTVTGMPLALADSISSEGNLQVEGRRARVKFVELVNMKGGKVN
jgi:hypothetical protein